MDPETPERHPAADPRITHTRGVVLAAARQLIVEEGYDAVTPTRLAALTGISRSTIYRRWPNTQDIAFEAIGTDTKRLPMTATGDPGIDLRAYLEELRDVLDSPQAALLATLVERAEHDGAACRSLRDIGIERRSMIRRLLNEPEDGFAAIQALVVGPLMFQRLVMHEPISDELISLLVEAYEGTRGE